MRDIEAKIVKYYRYASKEEVIEAMIKLFPDYVKREEIAITDKGEILYTGKYELNICFPLNKIANNNKVKIYRPDKRTIIGRILDNLIKMYNESDYELCQPTT